MGSETTRVKLQVIAESGNKCWLNGVITRDNPLTGHHIIPVRDGGLTIKENIAPITNSKHEAFNELERIYPDLAEEITYYLVTFRGNYSDQVIDRIDHIMSLAENRINKRRVGDHKKKIKKRLPHRR